MNSGLERHSHVIVRRQSTLISLAVVMMLCFALAPCAAFGEPLSLGDAVDAPALSWSTFGASGGTGWGTQTSITHDGVDAAQSGAVSDKSGGYSVLQTTVTGPGRISYWFKVDAYFTHYGVFKVDGVQQGLKYYGQFDWWQDFYDIPAGEHTLSWEYHKDLSYTGSYTDSMYLDHVEWAPTMPWGTMSINGDDATTASRYVYIDSSIAGATQMRFQNSGEAWSDWETFSGDRAWTLPTGLGVKTVNAQYRSSTGETLSLSDSIEVVSAAGTTVYVNAITGSDTVGNGTLGNPYKSITKGMQMVAEDGTVNAAMGTYGVATTNEVFPIDYKEGVSVEGAGNNSTVVLAINQTAFTIHSKTSGAMRALKITGLGSSSPVTGFYANNSALAWNGVAAEHFSQGLMIETGALDVTESSITTCTGDALYATGADIVVIGGVFSENFGNGVYVAAGTLAVSGASIEDNGGGIAVTGPDDVVVSDSELNRNKGHAVYADGDSTLPRSDLRVTRCTMDGNGALGPSFSTVQAVDYKHVILDGCAIANSHGRGVYLFDKARGTITDTSVSGSVSTGLLCEYVTQLSISNSEFNDNGGAGVEFFGTSTSTATADAVVAHGNTGGGMWLRGKSITASGCTFDANRGFGGVTFEPYAAGATPALLDSTVSNNSAPRPTDGGGGIRLLAGTDRGLVVARTQIESNVTSGTGGGVFQSGGTLELAECTVSGNTALSGVGGVFADRGAASLDECEVSDNSGTSAGGLSVVDGSLAVRGTTVTGNTAIGGGGGIDASESPLVIDDCTIGNNDTQADGGGVRCVGDDLHLSGSHVIYNTAATYGGGLAFEGQVDSADDCTVTGSVIGTNTAQLRGGGLSLKSTNALVQESTVTGNNCPATEWSAGGAGLWTGGWGITPKTTTIEECEITSNHGTGASGGSGGVCAQGSLAVVLRGTRIAGNTAPQHSAGALVAEGGVTLQDCIVEQNLSGAGSDNPVLRVAGGGTNEVSRCVFRDNRGARGTALFMSRGSIENCLFHSNINTGSGAGDAVISASDYADTLDIRGCTIADNDDHAAWSTGGGTVNFSDSVIWGNGGLFAGSGAVNIAYSDVQDAGWSGTGNINTDPGFIDAGTHIYRLAGDSPCIDIGSPTSTLAEDLDTVSRPQDGNGNGVARADMGCYEQPYFALNSGDAYCTSTAVTGAQIFVGAVQMRFNTGLGWTDWQTFSATRALTLPAGDGTKTVLAEFTFDSGSRTLSMSDSIILETDLPVITSLVSATHPNQDAWYSSVAAVGFAWSTSMPGVVDGYSWTIDTSADTNPDTTIDTTADNTTQAIGGTFGTHYFHVRAHASSGWGPATHFRVQHDGVAPVGSFAIDEGPYTRTRTIHATLAYSDDTPMEMRWSVNAGSTWSGWEPYAVHKTLELQAGDGGKEIHGQVRDAAHNIHSWGQGTTLDTTPPQMTLVSSPSHPAPAQAYPDANPQFTWTATDAGGTGVGGYSWALDNVAGTVPDTVAEGLSASAAFAGLADGVYYFHVRPVDAAGNWGSPATFSVRIEHATALTLTASTVGPVAYNAPITFTARLQSAGANIAARSDVTLWKLKAGSSTWTQVATMSWAPANGTYASVVKAPSTAVYEARFAGLPYLETASGRVTVRARSSLGTPTLSTSKPKRSKRFYAYGLLKPRHGGYTKVYIQRYSRGKYRAYATKSAKNYNYSSYTRWKLTLKLKSGKYRIRSYHSDVSHSAKYSAYKKFTVR